MARLDEYLLASNATFQQRAISSIIDYIINTIYTESPYDLQTVTITGSPTGGTFTLTGGPLGGNILTLPWNATIAQVQIAINAVLAGPSGASCICMGTSLPSGSIMVIWVGTLSQQPQNVMTANGSGLTGGSGPTASVAHTVTGVSLQPHPYHVAFATKFMSALGVSPTSSVVLGWVQMLASNAVIQTDYLNGQSSGNGVETQVTDAHIDAAVAAQIGLWSGAY
jgi:hypothetical protein